MLLHDAPRTSQPEPGATDRADIGGTKEVFEDVLHLGRGDAQAAIANPHRGHVAAVVQVLFGYLDADLSPAWAVLDRIREQVLEYSRESRCIPVSDGVCARQDLDGVVPPGRSC